MEMGKKGGVPYEAKDKTGNWDYLSFYIFGVRLYNYKYDYAISTRVWKHCI